MKEEFLQLTVLSSEVVKASMHEEAQISVSCSASELPKYNFDRNVAYHFDATKLATMSI